MKNRITGDSICNDRKMRVMLVDDQHIIAEAMKRMLSDNADIEFFYCQNPTRAIEAAKEFRPTVILQDLVMPDVDGLMLVKFFRACPDTRDIPLIVLSSQETPDINIQIMHGHMNIP